MKTKKTTLLMILCLALLIPVLSLADAAWEPQNDFFFKHVQECTYEYRTYYIKETVDVCDEPGGTPVYQLTPDEKEVFVYFSYTDEDGKRWAATDKRFEEEGWQSGWASMDKLELKYDSRSFREDHQAELVLPPEDEYVLPDLTMEEADKVVAWTYPNSGEYMDIIQNVTPDYPLEFAALYTDTLGRDWAMCDYYDEMSGFWVFMEDPQSEDVPLAPATPAPTPVTEATPEAVVETSEATQATPAPTAVQTQSPTSTPGDVTVVRNNGLMRRILLPILLVGGVVIVTAIVLLAVFLPKMRRR